MVSFGGTLVIAASIARFYMEGQFNNALRYAQYYNPMIIVGIGLIALSLVSFKRSQAKKEKER